MLSRLINVVAESGNSQLLYNAFFAAGFVAVLLFNLYNSKNYGISKPRALLLTFIVYTVTVIWMFFLYWVESGFQNWGGNNIVRIFIWVPVFAYPVAKAMHIEWFRICDYLAPCACIVQAVSHWGCIFEGCCHGYAWEHGIYNPALGYNTFPTQPLEALVALAVVIYIWNRAKKNNFAVDGESYPLMMILFGYSRFFLEFLRDNDKLFLGISNLAVHALIMGLVGTAAYFAVHEHNNKQDMRKISHGKRKEARA